MKFRTDSQFNHKFRKLGHQLSAINHLMGHSLKSEPFFEKIKFLLLDFKLHIHIEQCLKFHEMHFFRDF